MSQNRPIVPMAKPYVRNPAMVPKKITLWKKVGGASLFISVFIHLVILIIGLFWVFQVIREPEKKVDFMPPSGGGGSTSSDSKMKQYQMKAMQPNMARIAAQGVMSNLVLPDPDASSSMTSLGAISSSAASGGLGGGGGGGGKGNGNGKGKGVGDGFGAGLGNGGGLKNPFGMISPDQNALVGTFYDLKQTKDGKPTGFNDQQTLNEISEFVTRKNWNPRALDQYYKAPNTLYQTKFYIPIMTAAGAPNAFGCGQDVKPVNWMALYRGYVIPPRSGTFRFVGRADNVMVIRFNSRIVLDGGDYSACLGRPIWNFTEVEILAGRSKDRVAVREMEKAGYDIPVKSYKYSNAAQYNQRGGLMVGKDFTVIQDRKYPVEVLLSELGGLFGAALMIEEDGVTYKKDSTGSPVLPLFRLDHGLPTVPTETKGSPPYAPDGPIWKVAEGRMIDGI